MSFTVIIVIVIVTILSPAANAADILTEKKTDLVLTLGEFAWDVCGEEMSTLGRTVKMLPEKYDLAREKEHWSRGKLRPEMPCGPMKPHSEIRGSIP